MGCGNNAEGDALHANPIRAHDRPHARPRARAPSQQKPASQPSAPPSSPHSSTRCSPPMCSRRSSSRSRPLLLIQHLGKGPEPVVPKNAPLAIEWYRFKPSLEADMREAALLISLAQFGLILEDESVLATHARRRQRQADAQPPAGARAGHRSRQHLISTTPGALLPTLRFIWQAAARARAAAARGRARVWRLWPATLGL